MSGQIWWAQLGQNIATEVIGKGPYFLRPVVILQCVYGNACIVVPLTSQRRQGNYYFNFRDINGNDQCALMAQIRYIDGKRFKYQLADITKKDLSNLRIAQCELIKNNLTVVGEGPTLST